MRCAENDQERRVFLCYSLGANLLNIDFEKVMYEAYINAFHGMKPSKEEQKSWKLTREYVLEPLCDDGSLNSHGFFFELFPIKNRKYRIDLMIVGSNHNKKICSTIVEVKMHKNISGFTTSEGQFHGVNGLIDHPLTQAYRYQKSLQLHNAIYTKHNGLIQSCSFLPKATRKGNVLFFNYNNHLGKNFAKDELAELIDYHLAIAPNSFDNGKDLTAIVKNEQWSSPELASFMGKTSESLSLSDEQEKAVSSIVNAVMKNKSKKRIILVEGGPGTGKSVIGLKVFGELVRSSIGEFKYLANSANFRGFLQGMLYSASLELEDDENSNPQSLNRPDSYVDTFSVVSRPNRKNEYEILLIDEAQSLGNRFVLGTQQNFGLEIPAISIMLQSRVSVFFFDPKQKARNNMIGDKEYFEKCADLIGESDNVEYFHLNKTFRCGENEDVVRFIDGIFNFKDNTGEVFDFGDFDLELYDCIHNMIDDIKSSNDGGSKAIVASYAWTWQDKKDTKKHDVKVNCRCGKTYSNSWNETFPNRNNPLLGEGYIHAKENRIDENVLSIHTTQGVEFDHVGVILADDLSVDKYGQKLVVEKQHHKDKKSGVQEILNNYRIICTRAKKSLKIYSTNDSVNDFLKKSLY